MSAEPYWCPTCGWQRGASSSAPHPDCGLGNQARWAALKRDKHRCVTCGAAGEEVNHITPRNGAGYGSGCWHHLDGLETLCHPCHLRVTAQQRASRAGTDRQFRLVDTINGSSR